MAVVSSHVLDGVRGLHASGVQAKLSNLNSGISLFRSSTDASGRLSESISLAGFNPDDRYELIFVTGDYWADLGNIGASRLNEIVIRFTMPDREARYHLPVILSPNGYSMWHSGPEGFDR